MLSLWLRRRLLQIAEPGVLESELGTTTCCILAASNVDLLSEGQENKRLTSTSEAMLGPPNSGAHLLEPSLRALARSRLSRRLHETSKSWKPLCTYYLWISHPRCHTTSVTQPTRIQIEDKPLQASSCMLNPAKSLSQHMSGEAKQKVLIQTCTSRSSQTLPPYAPHS